jgi:glycogen debranching enzyme
VQRLARFNSAVFIEGAQYAGIWQECGPHESLVYSAIRPDIAINSHMIFFALQRSDGQLPANNKRSDTGFGQIQMVVPIAATAWELAQRTGDDELLKTAYDSCARWDQWLLRYRNTRGTGLVEGFCTFDTGHDNSPRWAGMPNQCPHKDAKICPSAPGLPRLCPDLSTTVYGGRVALSSMAQALGLHSEADRWTESAERIRQLILAKLYVPCDAAFYDLDAQGQYVRVRSDVLSRVCGEHVVDRKTFEILWERQLHNHSAFWAPYPLSSIALDDSKFVRPIPSNSWGGPSQALTALRAPRWFDYYGKPAELFHLMN